jgi:hypothetical protein
MGRFAKRARALLARMPRNARLCVISWIARNRFWFAVPPIAYAKPTNVHDKIGVCRSESATQSWSATTAATTNLVRGSWPMSFVTCFGRV